ncbi:hypothetical protein H310_01278 [Aphanomyces invadans]|uniref:Uncharacterized protein n=1 Tax=Aphanomyces invadans TaxID=157072 RepID=A0A024URE6_9STRA|nr:hypothetical protein H310_01278 [Aphanomyces invadans]ETW08760.1 hypothetical protein H310_01278 [Aphanomyces invadans]|eukprot:XP_008862565.1 hypothetical protein H310_01278 [Aphanomyces invadans]
MASSGNNSAECPCRRALLRKSIFTAAQDGDLDHVRSFFECRKADLPIDFVDDFGYTALHYASQSNRVDVVAYLLSRRASPDCARCGATPLHRAAYSGADESVALLIQHGASLNLVDTSFGDRRTALHKAASQGHRSVVDLLVKAGADTSLRDAAGYTYEDVPLEFGWQAASSPILLHSTCPKDRQVLASDLVCTVGLGRPCESCGDVCYAATRRPCCNMLECDTCSNETSQSCQRCGTWSNAIQSMTPPQPPRHNSSTILDSIPPKSTPSNVMVRGLFNLKKASSWAPTRPNTATVL